MAEPKKETNKKSTLKQDPKETIKAEKETIKLTARKTQSQKGRKTGQPYKAVEQEEKKKDGTKKK